MDNDCAQDHVDGAHEVGEEQKAGTSSIIMADFPDEIWTNILDYLDPSDIISTQRVSSRLLKVSRDSQLWRYKCYEEAPSAATSPWDRPNALSALTGALGGLSLNGLSSISAETGLHESTQSSHSDRRAKAVAQWDHTDASEQLDWYSEYIGRHAPLSVDWAPCQSNVSEARGMALFSEEEKVICPMDDGSLRIWDIKRPSNRSTYLHEIASSKSGMLFEELSPSPESSIPRAQSLGYAIDNIVIDTQGKRAYVSTESLINEVDLQRMSIISQRRYDSPITALSQTGTDNDFNLIIGTSLSLHLHDPREPLGNVQASVGNTSPGAGDFVDPTIAFLPKYTNSGRDQGNSVFGREIEEPQHFEGIRAGGTRAYARMDPGPQSILHHGQHEIIVAGRMPSILFYDHRFFPRLSSSIHSGARLSSMTTLPFSPVNDTSELKDQHTLIACGEYGGCGSLEIYGLSQAGLEEGIIGLTEDPSLVSETYQQSARSSVPACTSRSGFSSKNRQSASSSKLLSVCTQGARIVFSDAEGQLKWVERDGRGLVRRWNVNTSPHRYSFPTRTSTASPIPTSATIRLTSDVVRKMIPMPDPQSRHDHKYNGTTRGDDDLLVWTGEKIGIVTFKSRWDTSCSHEELVEAFESKMNLNADNSSSDEERDKEEEYARQMRRALERQADERRWMSRFGGRWR